jgi:hypothetical protein
MATMGQPDKTCLLVASLLAWVFETLQQNHEAGKIHIEAASRLLDDLNASQGEMDALSAPLLPSLNKVVPLAVSYSTFVCDDNPLSLNTTIPDEQIALTFLPPRITSLTQARDVFISSLVTYLASSKTASDTRVQRLFTRNWHRAVRDFCGQQATESMLYRRTLQVLFYFGMSFLPESETGSFSYGANPDQMRHHLTAFERFIGEDDATNQTDPDSLNIRETIVTALEVMIPHVYHDSIRLRAMELLSKLKPVPLTAESAYPMP